LPPKAHNWLVCTIAALCTFAITLMAQPVSAEVAYSVTETNKLVRFETGKTGHDIIGTISGTIGGEPILSIDFRPFDGRLYGISANRLYMIDPFTAQAQVVEISIWPNSPFPTPLVGNADMDFDPVTGMIRMVTDTNQNLRINSVNGAFVTDTPISGVAGVAAIAFTHNFPSSDRSTIVAISHTTNGLARIGGVDLNDGGASQAAGVATAGGGLMFDVDAPMGLDIPARDNEAFAVLTPAGNTQSGLYRVNLVNGSVTLIREVLVGERLRGLALVSRAVPMYLLVKPGNSILTVLSAEPASPMPGTGYVVITGLNTNEDVYWMATRPATGELVGLTSAGRLLNINPRTGQTTFLSQLSVPPGGAVFSFHPTMDHLRIMRSNGENLRVDPDTGIATAETVHSLTNLSAGAYAPDGSLYALAQGGLYRFMDPSTGVATPTGGAAAAPGDWNAMTIAPDGTGFFVYSPPATISAFLKTISLPDGDFSDILGRVAGPASSGDAGISAIAVPSPGRVRFSTANYSVLEGSLYAHITVQREAGAYGPISVHMKTSPGTATSPDDFWEYEHTVEFADGQTSKTIMVVIANGVTEENDETVLLTLLRPALGATIGTLDAATLTIVDNDPITGLTPFIEIRSPDPAYMANRPTASSRFITLAGLTHDPDGTITSVTWTTDRGFSGTASIGASTYAKQIEWYAADVPLAPGVNTITATTTDNDGNLMTTTTVVTLNDLSYYLAEGATGTFFDLDLLLANPNPAPVHITATFLKPLGQGTVEQHYTLPATSRTTIDVETIPGLENAEVSTIVTSPSSTPIVVERTMRWNETGYGAHTDKASPNASTGWYFAEGSQGFFSTYLLLANPHNVANVATVRYLRENTSVVTRTYNLNPLQRFTVDLSTDAELVNQSFGMEVAFWLPGIAERAMYFGVSPLWVGGHESVGVTHPSRTWFLAEGATGPFFETFVLFANPSTRAANVDVRYLPASGSPVERSYDVAAGQRLTINVEGEDATLANAAVATQVTSDVPIIVERAQYWPDPAPNWYEAHNSFGVTATATHWGLAEGRVGLTGNYQTYILLANPDTDPADVTITFLRENGTTLSKTFTVQPGNRFNVAVGGADTPEIVNERFSAVITATRPIVVERAMYSDLDGVTWQAGTNATATRLP
jgi:hypothetical protein